MQWFLLECLQLCLCLLYSLLVPNLPTFSLCLFYTFVLASSALHRFKPRRSTMAILFAVSLLLQLVRRVYSNTKNNGTLQLDNLY